MENWYVPITILPSIGFFIVATTSIANSLSAEIARLIEQQKHSERQTIYKKIQQLRLVNQGLVCLYAAAVVLALAGLIGGLESTTMTQLYGAVDLLICVGIGFTILALCMMMIYSMRSIRIKERQFKGDWE
ncbi:MAG: hypothetical protein AAF242_06715 [Bacteroidota bacterium]